MQAYSDPSRESDGLPDVEVFFRSSKAIALDDWRDEDGDLMQAGWYWWACFPGCLPDSDPCGPFGSAEEALADAQESNA